MTNGNQILVVTLENLTKHVNHIIIIDLDYGLLDEEPISSDAKSEGGSKLEDTSNSSEESDDVIGNRITPFKRGRRPGSFTR